MKSYHDPESISRIFAALQGAHGLSRRTRWAAVFFCSVLLPIVACMVAFGAVEAFDSHRVAVGLVVGGAGLALLVYLQWIQWIILTTRFAFSPEALSQTHPRSHSWTLERNATSCVELHFDGGQATLRALDSDGKPHLIQLTPQMRSALAAAQLWPAA